MIVSIVVFLAAIAMAGIAAYVSIIGLAAIFSAAGALFIAFAASMEVAKISCALWLHSHWKDKGLFLIKSGMTISVVVLMLFTSMGVFGFLSKSHIEQTAPLAGIQESNSVLEQKIISLQSRIDRNNRLIEQLDQAIQGYIDNNYITKAIQVRESQASDRAKVSAENDELQSQIDEIRIKLAESNTKVQLIETEVGPIKYAAELIYGSSEKDVLEEAVRLLIMMMVLVFDPLAIMMLIAAQHSFEKRRHVDEKGTQESEELGDFEETVPEKEVRYRSEKTSVAEVENAAQHGVYSGNESITVTTSMDTDEEHSQPEEILQKEEISIDQLHSQHDDIEKEPEIGAGLAGDLGDLGNKIDMSRLPERQRRFVERILKKNKKLIDRYTNNP